MTEDNQGGPTAVIIGAGPAGLTAAWELLERTDIRPIVLEADDEVGGLSRTVNYKGNRIDIGGHRFFSKSDRVMEWWRRVLPLQGRPKGGAEISYQNQSRWIDTTEDGPDPATEDDVMLVRQRTSRILFRGRFFDYPLNLSLSTLGNLGLRATIRIGLSFLRARLMPIRPEMTLEDFVVNRFGRELYETFFRDYTEKVWGVPCGDISAEWGAQRIKGLSLSGLVKHALSSIWRKIHGRDVSIAQKDTETSLIEQFLYPKYGPGQMWQKVADDVRARGGEVRFGCRVNGLNHRDGRVVSAIVETAEGVGEITADYFFSTMAVRDLMAGMSPPPPEDEAEVAAGLIYRDFITVGLLLDRMEMGAMPDNWIYVQEPEVKVGRLQIFNNWSPYMVADPAKFWIGLEYFCDEGDELWRLDDDAMCALAIRELGEIGIAATDTVSDSTVIRVPKTYPAYFGSYDRFDVVRRYLDGFENLYPLGRNGMHRYNNQDHSMLTAMVAVDNIVDGVRDRDALWSVNAEAEYHEDKQDGA